ncbi:MAG: Hpt domain-containing protein [Campylobacteraceae bacterium]|nr:Hpt domain-containing protein [Campylobacteraceae bacterium]
MNNRIKIEDISKRTHMSIEMATKLIDIFYKSTYDILDKMDDAIKTNDFDKIFRTSHTIKGSASNLLFKDLEDLAREIEDASKNNINIEYSKKLIEIKAVLANTKFI